MNGAASATRLLTTTEAAVLALLALNGEQSGYDLLRQSGKAIGQVWAPAKSQLYAVLPRLARDGLAESRAVVQSARPDKQLYRITSDGRAALDSWLETPEANAGDAFLLKLFVGGLTSPEVLIGHVELFRGETEARLEELRAIEATNVRSGNDFFHYFLLRLGIERAESIRLGRLGARRAGERAVRARLVSALAVVVLGIACTSSPAQRVADPSAAADVRKLAAEMERIHPNLFHSVSREDFRGAVDRLLAHLPELERDELLVEVLRVVAMTGERDGHMGLFPLVNHARPLRLVKSASGLSRKVCTSSSLRNARACREPARRDRGKARRRGRCSRAATRDARQRVEPAPAAARVHDHRGDPPRARHCPFRRARAADHGARER